MYINNNSFSLKQMI